MIVHQKNKCKNIENNEKNSVNMKKNRRTLRIGGNFGGIINSFKEEM
jgi:hypothetical protein